MDVNYEYYKIFITLPNTTALRRLHECSETASPISPVQ